MMNLSNMAILLLSWGSVWESVKLRVRGVAMEGAICWAILIGSCRCGVNSFTPFVAALIGASVKCEWQQLVQDGLSHACRAQKLSQVKPVDSFQTRSLSHLFKLLPKT